MPRDRFRPLNRQLTYSGSLAPSGHAVFISSPTPPSPRGRRRSWAKGGRRQQPRIMVMDIAMPGSTGSRRRRGWQGLPRRAGHHAVHPRQRYLSLSLRAPTGALRSFPRRFQGLSSPGGQHFFLAGRWFAPILQETGPSYSGSVMTPPVSILLVDDSQAFLAAAGSFLSAHSMLVVIGAAPSGEAGVEEARALMPDLVLMDLNMPGVGGLEATHQGCGESASRRDPDASRGRGVSGRRR